MHCACTRTQTQTHTIQRLKLSYHPTAPALRYRRAVALAPTSSNWYQKGVTGQAEPNPRHELRDTVQERRIHRLLKQLVGGFPYRRLGDNLHQGS